MLFEFKSVPYQAQFCCFQHDGLDLHFDGQVTTHKNQALMDNLAMAYTASKPSVFIGRSIVFICIIYIILQGAVLHY